MIVRTDTLQMILDVAFARGTASPARIVLRPEKMTRILEERPFAIPATLDTHGVPLVVSSKIPFFPGFEIQRVKPRRRNRV